MAGSKRAAGILAAAMLLAPAIGVPGEWMLQDTLKSIVVAFAALFAALAFFSGLRREPRPVSWHPVLWLPLLLVAHALASMALAHAYLAGAEAIRWSVFTLLLWLGLNTLTAAHLPRLAWGIHAGAVIASSWTALQFWFDFGFFAQGPNPASTFANRNFFAEFAVCTLPFGAVLLARAGDVRAAVAIACSLGVIVAAILMTGTRSALLALWLQLLVVFPLAAWRLRDRWGVWSRRRLALVAAAFLAAIVALGSLPTGNARLVAEGRGGNALERGFARTASIQPGDESLGLRMEMWGATLRMAADRPLTGVGAGAWEVHIPLYEPGREVETDYYAHNEPLQLLAEYGLAGAVFLLGLAAWLLTAAGRAWRESRAGGGEEAPWRVAALASLLALMLVSQVGFPWRMAATGALFALCLSIVAAGEVQPGRSGARAFAWRPAWTTPALAATGGALLLATWITALAAEAERKLVRASEIAMAISASGSPDDPRWNDDKARMLRLVREGIAANPHYRKITPIVADELASWGDWRNATWIWESVLASRPHIVAILTNAARGHAAMQQPEQAFDYLARAQAISPTAPSVLSLEVILLWRFRDAAQALRAARAAVATGRHDYDLLDNAFLLAWRAGDRPFAEQVLQMRLVEYPARRVDAYIDAGSYQLDVYGNEEGALRAWRQALALAPADRHEDVLAQVPAPYRARLRLP